LFFFIYVFDFFPLILTFSSKIISINRSRPTVKGGKGADSELNSRQGAIVAPNNFSQYEKEGGLEFSPAAVLTASFVFIGVVIVMHVVSKFVA
jgi:hypothetical protein